MSKKLKKQTTDIRPFGWQDKLGYAMGDMGCGFSFQLVSTFMQLFYMQYIGIGEEAYAIPVYGCSYPKYPCKEDRTYIPEYWDICWKQICDRRGGFQDYLFVEIDEEDEV